MDTYQRHFGPQILIDWNSQNTEVLLNPAWPAEIRRELFKLTEQFPHPAHIWIASSGTSAQSLKSVKMIALSRSAFLASAQSVNQHLKSDSSDVWLNVLPTFHVGGLSIYARAFLSQARVVSQTEGWDPVQFCQALINDKITLTSLVPTQVFDLVQKKLSAPSYLRAVVVGGGALSAELYNFALDLGWPLLPSFGMTECCSQVATAELSGIKVRNSKMKILDHVQAALTADGKLKIKSQALLTGFSQWQNQWQNEKAVWTDPKVQDWFVSEDHAILEDGYLIPQGRSHHYIKILGEGVSLFRLQEILEQIVRQEDGDNWQDYALLSVPHARKENEIVIVHAGGNSSQIEKILNLYNSQVLSIEKAEKTISVSSIPRTDLGKIKYEMIAQDLKNLAR